MDFQDKTLVCVDCGQEFTWTASEQKFYADKGFTNPPKRCPKDRAAKKSRMGDSRGGYNSGPRQSFPIVCANCGAHDTVPFEPKGDKPVLCRNCFKQQRQA